MRIIKILEVVDTRTWDEGPDDRWHPIPGSGDVNQCARCGRDHEVHARVELEDGTAVVVGTGCMKAEDADGAVRAAKSGANTAKTIARLRAQLAIAKPIAEKAKEAAHRAYTRGDVPPVTFDGVFGVCGDVRSKLFTHLLDKGLETRERFEKRYAETMELHWREARYVEAFPAAMKASGYVQHSSVFTDAADRLERDLRRAEKRLAIAIAASADAVQVESK